MEETEPELRSGRWRLARRLSIRRAGQVSAVIVGLALSALAAVLFYRYTTVDGLGAYLESDLPGHLVLLQKAVNGEGWPPHFLFHWLTYLLSFGISSWNALVAAAVAVLSAAVLTRYLVTNAVIVKSFDKTPLTALIAAGLVFATPLPNWWGSSIFLGQLSGAQWHNPTSIFTLPLAIALFYVGLAATRRCTWQLYAFTSALMLLNAVSKPNYLIAFLPVWALCSLRSTDGSPGISRRAAYAAVAAVPALGALTFQYLATFGEGATGGISVAPFLVWAQHSPNPLASLVLSTAFPLAFLAGYWRESWKDEHLATAWLVFAVAVGMFALLAENGRAVYGNFGWGAHLSIAVLFIATAASYLQVARLDLRSVLVGAFLLGHVATGVWFFFRLLQGISYSV